MDHIRNLLLIITTMGALLSVSGKYANTFFDEILKSKFNKFNCQETFSYIFIKWIGGLVFILDAIGLILTFVNIDKDEHSNIMKEYSYVGIFLFISIILLLVAIFIIGLNVREIYNGYIKKMMNPIKEIRYTGKRVAIDISMVTSFLTTVIYSFLLCRLVYQEMNNGKAISVGNVEVFIIIFGLLLIGVGLFVLARSFKYAIKKIESNDLYIFKINDDIEEDRKTNIFIQLEDYYVLYNEEDEDFEYIPKNKIKSIIVKKDEENNVSISKKAETNVNRWIDIKLKVIGDVIKQGNWVTKIIFGLVYLINFIVLKLIFKFFLFIILLLVEIIIEIVN